MNAGSLGRLMGVLLLTAAVLLSAAVSGCGYALAGRGSSLPSYIRTIGVPAFTNKTTVFEMERILTTAVRDELIGRGSYKVVPEREGVDGLLTGEITTATLAPTGFTEERQASRYVLTITAAIEFRDMKTNKVIWENRAMAFTEEYEATSDAPTTDAAAFFGQETNAVERVSRNFAKSVVSSIMEAF